MNLFVNVIKNEYNAKQNRTIFEGQKRCKKANPASCSIFKQKNNPWWKNETNIF